MEGLSLHMGSSFKCIQEQEEGHRCGYLVTSSWAPTLPSWLQLEFSHPLTSFVTLKWDQGITKHYPDSGII